MSITLRLDESENCVITLPFAGHAQSSLAPSSGAALEAFGTGLVSAGVGFGAGATIARVGAGAASCVAGLPGDATPAGGWTSRSACSEYGSLIAFGCVL